VKTILCFGDSNTWGSNPTTGDRYAPDVRWPGVLRATLGSEYEVIEEGMPGRTTVFEDPLEPYKCGKEYLPPCLRSHAPLDLVIILLGTNDVQTRYSASALDIALGCDALIGQVEDSEAGPEGIAPEVLLVAPPPLKPVPEPWVESFEGGEEKTRRLAGHYRRITETRSCAFFDAGERIASSDEDGVHWEASEHTTLGKALAPVVRRLIG
jgi:lysophospholipase L1-like esterase